MQRKELQLQVHRTAVPSLGLAFLQDQHHMLMSVG